LKMCARRVRGGRDTGFWVGELLEGCKLCMRGLKSVLFITGLCRDRCFYCPISKGKRGDNTYINEVRSYTPWDAVLEVDACGSRGVGVTGGDPLLRLERVVEYVRVLKEVFGRSFHVHLYTSGSLLSSDVMERLVNAGVDEIRIHVIGEKSWSALRVALQYPVTVAVENPALPDGLEALKKLLLRAWEVGVRFVNLNELEFSESNELRLRLRGYRVRESGVAAEGSEEVALTLLRWVVEEGIDLNLHYCPARFKDSIQFRARLTLRGLRTRLPFEEVVDGVVRWVEVRPANQAGEALLKDLMQLVASDAAFVKGGAVLTHPRVAEKVLRETSSLLITFLEAYPTTPRLILSSSITGNERIKA